MRHKFKQKGAAILVALFITSLVAAVAIAMLWRTRIDIRKTELISNSNQAYFIAEGSVQWAIDQLKTNWEKRQTGKIIDNTPIESAENILQSFKIKNTLYDAQGFFNINNLSDTDYQKFFAQWIHVLEPKLNDEQIRLMISAVIDWITPGLSSTALDADYAKLNPPYRSAHKRMVSASELRFIKNIPPAIYEKLSSYLIALPTVTPINVNNASASLRMALNPAIQNQGPFINQQDFLNKIKTISIATDKITFTSDYFLLKTDVKVDQQNLIFYTLLKRVIKDNRVSILILWQMQGTL